MKKYLSLRLPHCLSFLLAASMIIGVTQANAATYTPTKKSTHRVPTTAVEPDEIEPDTSKSTAVEYNCASTGVITIYKNPDDDSHIALRWLKRVHRMDRVATDTGANRFENRRYHLIWIGIPSKGILLDSKKGQQLANDCKNKEQMR